MVYSEKVTRTFKPKKTHLKVIWQMTIMYLVASIIAFSVEKNYVVPILYAGRCLLHDRCVISIYFACRSIRRHVPPSKHQSELAPLPPFCAIFVHSFLFPPQEGSRKRFKGIVTVVSRDVWKKSGPHLCKKFKITKKSLISCKSISWVFPCTGYLGRPK